MPKELKHSDQRDALFALLSGVKCHPSAEWLYGELKKDWQKMSLATVYRNLGILCENGDAIRLDIGDGTVRYDARTCDHNHFFCTCCQALSDIGEHETDGIDRMLEEKYGVKIASHSFIFYGTCPSCHQKQEG